MTWSLDTFAGLPQFMWENIFGLLDYLVPGVILAMFAAFYQNRRKREIKIEGKIAVARIETYEKILALFYKAQDLQTPTLEEESRAKDILAYFPSETYHCQYPKMFEDEATFDSFYGRFQELRRECQIYLDYTVYSQMSHSLFFFTFCKNQLDAYSDTERVVDFKFLDSQSRRHIDWAYRLCGMLMFNHCTRVFVELDNVICSQLRHFRITCRKYRLRRLFSNVRDWFLFIFDLRKKHKGVMEKISQRIMSMSISKENHDMVDIMLDMTGIMRYVHFSDKYSPSEFFEGRRAPSKKDVALYNAVFLSQVHKS